MAPPVFKTGLAGIAFAGRFDSFPPPPALTLLDFFRSRHDTSVSSRPGLTPGPTAHGGSSSLHRVGRSATTRVTVATVKHVGLTGDGWIPIDTTHPTMA